VLDRAVSEGYSGVDWIDVLDLDRVERDHLDRDIPDRGEVAGTPVAGFRIDGILGERGFGWKAVTFTRACSL
jgi:hypothetical protein